MSFQELVSFSPETVYSASQNKLLSAFNPALEASYSSESKRNHTGVRPPEAI